MIAVEWPVWCDFSVRGDVWNRSKFGSRPLGGIAPKSDVFPSCDRLSAAHQLRAALSTGSSASLISIELVLYVLAALVSLPISNRQ